MAQVVLTPRRTEAGRHDGIQSASVHGLIEGGPAQVTRQPQRPPVPRIGQRRFLECGLEGVLRMDRELLFGCASLKATTSASVLIEVPVSPER